MSQSQTDVLQSPCAAVSLYVNYFEVAHSQYEFLMELGQYRPGRDDESGSLAIHTRLAIAPPYAKMLSELLRRAIAEHESGHGLIGELGDSPSPFDIILHSLPEFESRARELRERRRSPVKSTSTATNIGGDSASGRNPTSDNKGELS